MTNKTEPDRPSNPNCYKALLDAIREGTLKPGDRLRETEIAARFGVSRTPVREAVRHLEADGLVSYTPRAGASVRRLDSSEVSELYDMRAVLESTAAKFATRAASEVEIDELSSIHEEMTNTSDINKLQQLNQLFHRCLLDASRNRFLMKATQTLDKTLLILGPSTLSDTERHASANKEHDDIVQAVKARDAQSAETAMRIHIEAAHRARLQQLRQRQEHTIDVD